jgi:hypothetical protein
MPTVRLTPKTAPGQSALEENVALTWRTAPDIRRRFDNPDYMRAWTTAFREQYRRITSGELNGTTTGQLGSSNDRTVASRFSVAETPASRSRQSRESVRLDATELDSTLRVDRDAGVAATEYVFLTDVRSWIGGAQ